MAGGISGPHRRESSGSTSDAWQSLSGSESAGDLHLVAVTQPDSVRGTRSPGRIVGGTATRPEGVFDLTLYGWLVTRSGCFARTSSPPMQRTQGRVSPDHCKRAIKGAQAQAQTEQGISECLPTLILDERRQRE
ncbi:hypothetical protein AAFF_G00310400 [Aldrovandia affinis]|uniref:Uncharacterized protein n=1 Tax=Aldrovandia affinis TaxID=143900 RepID=A0AAD7R7Y0_9TELE|nr:hypothetical protein AAFF_G00310400 [Aldrovandia affinis]